MAELKHDSESEEDRDETQILLDQAVELARGLLHALGLSRSSARNVVTVLQTYHGDDITPAILDEVYEVVSAMKDLGDSDPNDFLQKLYERANDQEGTHIATTGPVFALPEFAHDLRVRQLDVELRIVGPKRQEGVAKCPKCKSMSTETTEKQTRSADEGMTEFNVCFQCGHHWKVNA